MRVPTRPQSHLRYPLNRILASEGAVRVLRELARHGGTLSIPSLAVATKLNQQTVRNTLMGYLSATGVVEPLGQGRTVLYRLRSAHPLHEAVTHLFAAEDARVQHVFQALRDAARAAGPDIFAIWVYGSVARGEDGPGSDLDLALVVRESDPDVSVVAFRDFVSSALDREQVALSLVGLTLSDVQRLAASDDPWWQNVLADGWALLGPPPAVVAQTFRRDSSDQHGAGR